jgi:hypothetical protein
MRYVIHHHQTVPEHYDFMLERDGSLETFRIGMGEMDGLLVGKTVPAVKIQDHKLDYLAYEGPVSCDRGSVTIFDEGMYREEGLADDGIRYLLLGKRFSGRLLFSPSGDGGYSVQYQES